MLFTTLFISLTVNAEQQGIWVHVDIQRAILTVFDGDVEKDVFNNIAIGQSGATLHKQQGDDKTPLGRYHIAWVNPNSRFRTFYGISYPSREDGERAFKTGRITSTVAATIKQAHAQHRKPPQNTILGGQLGIHGLGRADPHVHQTVNWTHGCIALTNKQIDRLGRWIKPGTEILIQ
jgi:murein L,D-transpeptidase YafK